MRRPGIPEEEQYEAWAKLALDAIDGYDGLYIHIKGPDVPAHDGDHEAKNGTSKRSTRSSSGACWTASIWAGPSWP